MERNVYVNVPLNFKLQLRSLEVIEIFGIA